MLIVPRFPTMFANSLLANWTPYMRSVAVLSLLITSTNLSLIPVTQSAVTTATFVEINPLTGTLLRLDPRSTFVYDNWRPLLTCMSDS